MNRAEILNVIGGKLGNAMFSGPDLAEQLASATGDSVESCAVIVNYYQHQHANGLLPGMQPVLASKRAPWRPLINAAAEMQADAEYKAELAKQIAALKASNVADERTPWEIEQQRREDAESLFNVARHEARHALVGLVYGAKIRSASARSTDGIVMFDHIPEKHQVIITAAGSAGDPRGIYEPGASSDRKIIEAEFDKKFADLTPYERSYAEAHDLVTSQEVCEGMVVEHARFYQWLRNQLVQRGTVPGHEIHAAWDECTKQD